jgi:carbon storage regulator
MTRGAPVLVLTRRANQRIMIGQDVVITVLEIRGDQVRLGIRAPRSVEVHREEVFLEVTRPAPSTGSGTGAGRERASERDGPLPPGAV